MPLTKELIYHLMSKEKSNQVSKIKINEKKLRNMIPENIKINNIEEFIMNAVEYYGIFFIPSSLGIIAKKLLFLKLCVIINPLISRGVLMENIIKFSV